MPKPSSTQYAEECDLLDPREAEEFIIRKFEKTPNKLKHILTVAELARQSARDINELAISPAIDELVAYCAGLLHDIGCLEELGKTGFHPLDGYRYLLAAGFPSLAEVALNHSTSREEAALLNLPLPVCEQSLICDLVTYWDMRVLPGGELSSYEERVIELSARYGPDSIPACAARSARPRLFLLFERLELLLQKKPQ